MQAWEYGVSMLFALGLIGGGLYLLSKIRRVGNPPQEPPAQKPYIPNLPNEIRFTSWEAYNAYIDDYCRRHGTEGLNVRFEGYLPEDK